MNDLSVKLSAYLDGELDPAEAEAIEERLATDAKAQAELDALMQADVVAQEQFAGQLDDPVPLALVREIKNMPVPEPQAAGPARPIWGAMAASLFMFVIGGLGGYLLREESTPAPTGGWLQAVADYHVVYASQERHLVEVGADEADHIKAWLGNTVGASFSIPDLSGYGLNFEGGRLLVANAKPVAQLMYRLQDGTVIALCLQRSNADPTAPLVFNERTINGFDFVSWSANGADYVVIGPSGQPDLQAIATTASTEV